VSLCFVLVSWPLNIFRGKGFHRYKKKLFKASFVEERLGNTALD